MIGNDELCEWFWCGWIPSWEDGLAVVDGFCVDENHLQSIEETHYNVDISTFDSIKSVDD